jgi:hypothetical protein
VDLDLTPDKRSEELRLEAERVKREGEEAQRQAREEEKKGKQVGVELENSLFIVCVLCD